MSLFSKASIDKNFIDRRWFRSNVEVCWIILLLLSVAVHPDRTGFADFSSDSPFSLNIQCQQKPREQGTKSLLGVINSPNSLLPELGRKPEGERL